jgi:hypothetical protein
MPSAVASDATAFRLGRGGCLHRDDVGLCSGGRQLAAVASWVPA